MKKNIILFVALLSAFVTSQAEVIITPRTSTTFKFTPDDIWNINVQYLGTGSPEVTIEALIVSSQGQVLEVKSNPTVLKTGLISFTSISLGTRSLQYLNKAMSNAVSILGSFPPGSYSICYRVKCVDPNCDGAGAGVVTGEIADCSNLIVEPSTPLLLNFPEDRAELNINQKRPTFSWIPPSPISQVEGFNYQYTLVEARMDQKCEDAIQRNRPLYRTAGLTSNVMPYPADINGLDTGKKYCWQVHGLTGKQPVANSEVWEFTLKEDTLPKEDPLVLSYVDFANQDAENYFITHGELKLKYSSRKASHSLTYSIYKNKSEEAETLDQELTTKRGDSYFKIQLSDVGSYKPGDELLVKIQDGRETFELIYTYKNK